MPSHTIKTDPQDEKDPEDSSSKTPLVKVDAAQGVEDFLNPAWIESRLAQVGIRKLIKEFESSKDKNVQTIKATLILSQHILNKHPEAVRGQLQARLVGRTETELQPFQQLPKETIQIRSELKTINQQGGLLSKTLVGHSDIGRSVSISTEHHHVYSCARESRIRVWDLETGIEKKNFETDFFISIMLPLHLMANGLFLTTKVINYSDGIWKQRKNSLN